MPEAPPPLPDSVVRQWASEATASSFYAPDYAGVIEAQRFNKVQVAWYGNKSAIEAVDRVIRAVPVHVARRGHRLPERRALLVGLDAPRRARRRPAPAARADGRGQRARSARRL